MPQKIKLILNPICNHGRSLKNAADLKPLLAGYDIHWSGTEYPDHATELARQAGLDGCDLVLALGGDGTVHEVVNGLMQVPPEQRPSLGIIPLGSGNDFAHILGIPGDPAQAMTSALHGQDYHMLDAASVTDGTGRSEFFINTIGIGFDAVVNLHARKITRVHGFPMYFLALMQTIFRNFDILDLHVETDQEQWDQQALMLAVGNGPREGGGFLVTPAAKYDDDLLNYVIVQKMSRLMMLRLVPEFMNGTHGRFKTVRMGTCRRLSLTSRQPLYVHTDGEVFAGFGMDVRQLTIQILPQAIRYVRG